jgi:hypothetical protein
VLKITEWIFPHNFPENHYPLKDGTKKSSLAAVAGFYHFHRKFSRKFQANVYSKHQDSVENFNFHMLLWSKNFAKKCYQESTQVRASDGDEQQAPVPELRVEPLARHEDGEHRQLHHPLRRHLRHRQQEQPNARRSRSKEPEVNVSDPFPVEIRQGA